MNSFKFFSFQKIFFNISFSVTNFILTIIILCIYINLIIYYNRINIINNQSLNNFYNSNQIIDNNNTYIINSDNSQKLFWPTPGYHKITSPFGTRISPITGKISTHSGIDIGALEGSYIYSISYGKVVFIGFNGANGYSIHIQNNNYIFIYGHVSPNYIISINDIIEKGQIIGNVGPKYVELTSHNPYKDSTGKTTNGSTTGPHLHLTIKKDGKPVNPIEYFN